MDENTKKLKRQVRDFFNKNVKDITTLKLIANLIGLKEKNHE